MSVSYKQTSVDGRWDTIVVGSGPGGLVLAALLAKHAQKRVLVLERHYAAGGFTHVFRRPGWEWDVGLHYVGEMEREGGIGSILRDATNGALRWEKMPEVYDEIRIGDRRFELRAGKDAFVETLGAAFPGEEATLRAYVDLIRQASADIVPFFAERALPRRTARLTAPLASWRARRWLDRTVEDVLRPYVRDPLLFDVLTAQWGDYGLPPREASFALQVMVAGHYLDGGYYPVGGAGAIAASIEPVIEAAGGRVLVRAGVSEIVIEEGRAVGVRMEDGRELRAPIVVSDAGARATWLKLVPPEHAGRTGLPEHIRAVAPSVGHLCLYLGLEGTSEALGLHGTNLWRYPDGDRDAALAAFRADPEHAPFPVVYVSFPSAKDPTWSARFPNRSTIEMITLAWPEWLRDFRGTRWHKRGADYDAWKERMTARLLGELDRIRPDLRAKIVHAELSTPLSTAHFTGHDAGEMYGLSHGPDRFRLPFRAATPIDGLFVTGQDLATCGVGGAVLAAAICAGAILARDPMSVLRTNLARRGMERGAIPVPVT